MASYQYVFGMRNLGKAWPGGKEVLKNINLQFLPSAKIGVLGYNGAGKSTLLKIMAGEITDFSGEAWAADGLKIGYLAQEPQLDASKSVGENVMEAFAEQTKLLQRFEEVSAQFAEVTDDEAMNNLIAEQAELQEKIDAADAWDLSSRAEVAMEALRCPAAEQAVDNLSGGEKRRVALCRLLLSRPDMLLLDEPTNHLDAESIAWLQRFLADYPGTVVMITHDRYFLDNVTSWILELDRGQGIPYEGNYSSWLEQKEKRLAQEGREQEARMRNIAAEREWISASPKARQAKSKARVTAYENLVADADAREKQVDTAQIIIPSGPRLGNKVIEAVKLSKAFGDKLLIDNLNFRLPAGGIVGIIGPNGAGKTTLFRMITGLEKPDNGELILGETVKLGYVDQSRHALSANATVWEEISGGVDILEIGKRKIPSRAYVGTFNFRGVDQQKKVGQLSGGERNRVHLAKMLRSEANVLLLDEPTNDLDVDTLRALEDGLLGYAGCAVVISHDRWFLNRIATHILAFEGDSHVEWFEGNYQDYEADRRRRMGADADRPHRIKYRRLER